VRVRLRGAAGLTCGRHAPASREASPCCLPRSVYPPRQWWAVIRPRPNLLLMGDKRVSAEILGALWPVLREPVWMTTAAPLSLPAASPGTLIVQHATRLAVKDQARLLQWLSGPAFRSGRSSPRRRDRWCRSAPRGEVSRGPLLPLNVVYPGASEVLRNRRPTDPKNG